jgi:hypothetical protein
MDEDILLPFDLPAVARKKVSAAFDGGRVTSAGGSMLLAQAERRIGIADRLTRISQRGSCIRALDLRKSFCESDLYQGQGKPDADGV